MIHLGVTKSQVSMDDQAGYVPGLQASATSRGASVYRFINKALDTYDEHSPEIMAALRITRFTGNGLRLVVPRWKNVDVLGFMRVFAFLDIPSNVRDICRTTAKFFNNHRKVALTWNEKADHLMKIVGKAGEIFDNMATGIWGLGAMGIILTSPMGWLNPLFIVGIGLQTVNLIQGTKVSIESWRVLKTIKQLKSKKNYSEVQGAKANGLARIVKMLQDKRAGENSFIRKHFKTKGSVFMDCLSSINGKIQQLTRVGASKIDSDFGNAMADKVTCAMRKFLRHKIAQHIISVVAFSIIVIGIGILVSTPPLVPVAFTLLAVGSAISLANRYYAKNTMQTLHEELLETEEHLQ